MLWPTPAHTRIVKRANMRFPRSQPQLSSPHSPRWVKPAPDAYPNACSHCRSGVGTEAPNPCWLLKSHGLSQYGSESHGPSGGRRCCRPHGPDRALPCAQQGRGGCCCCSQCRARICHGCCWCSWLEPGLLRPMPLLLPMVQPSPWCAAGVPSGLAALGALLARPRQPLVRPLLRRPQSDLLQVKPLLLLALRRR